MAATANLSTCCSTSFPGHGRNSLAASASSNCYFCCQKDSITNQISECCHMTTIKPNNCVMHWTVAVSPIHFNSDHSITLIQVFCTMIVFKRLVLHFSNRTNSKQLLPRAGKPHSAITLMLHPYTVWTSGISQAWNEASVAVFSFSCPVSSVCVKATNTREGVSSVLSFPAMPQSNTLGIVKGYCSCWIHMAIDKLKDRVLNKLCQKFVYFRVNSSSYSNRYTAATCHSTSRS